MHYELLGALSHYNATILPSCFPDVKFQGSLTPELIESTCVTYDEQDIHMITVVHVFHI
jgi:hypothetical protein